VSLICSPIRVIINSENRAVAKRLPTPSFYDLIEPIGLNLDQKDRTGFDRITLHDCPKSGKPHAYSQPRRCVRCETQLCKVGLVTFSAYLFSPIHLGSAHQITSNRNARPVFSSIAILFLTTRQQRIPETTPWPPDASILYAPALDAQKRAS
jgi:hypothetical protein